MRWDRQIPSIWPNLAKDSIKKLSKWWICLSVYTIICVYVYHCIILKHLPVTQVVDSHIIATAAAASLWRCQAMLPLTVTRSAKLWLSWSYSQCFYMKNQHRDSDDKILRSKYVCYGTTIVLYHLLLCKAVNLRQPYVIIGFLQQFCCPNVTVTFSQL